MDILIVARIAVQNIIKRHEYGAGYNTGHYYASNSVFLKRKGKGSFTVLLPASTAFIAEGDKRKLQK